MLGRAAALIVVLYQKTVSPLLGSHCRFAPSCSSYAIQALRTNGIVVGGAQSVWRLLRCAPWSQGGIDYPPAVGSLTGRLLRRRETTRAQ